MARYNCARASPTRNSSVLRFLARRQQAQCRQVTHRQGSGRMTHHSERAVPGRRPAGVASDLCTSGRRSAQGAHILWNFRSGFPFRRGTVGPSVGNANWGQWSTGDANFQTNLRRSTIAKRDGIEQLVPLRYHADRKPDNGMRVSPCRAERRQSLGGGDRDRGRQGTVDNRYARSRPHVAIYRVLNASGGRPDETIDVRGRRHSLAEGCIRGSHLDYRKCDEMCWRHCVQGRSGSR